MTWAPSRCAGLFRDALDDLDSVDLLVVNGGSGRRDPDFDGSDDGWLGFHARLAGWARAGGAVLGLHQAANTFYDAPDWSAVLGGRWVPGESMHPPIGQARFELTQGHPVTEGLDAVEAFDERYCRLQVAPATRILGTTPDDDGAEQPDPVGQRGARRAQRVLGPGPRRPLVRLGGAPGAAAPFGVLAAVLISSTPGA